PNCRAGDDQAASEVLTINTATLGKLASRLAAMERQISVLRKENDNIWQVNNTLRQQLEGGHKKVTPVIMKPPASNQQVTLLEEQNKNIQEENHGLKQRLEELEAKQDATQKMLHAISCTVE
ncbi:hypothetical protein BKA81DRAFT_406946, partial [Phyllosticta paracitricarpa]